jgi:hypothetical protein
VLGLVWPGSRVRPIHCVRGCLGVQLDLEWMVVIGFTAGFGVLLWLERPAPV